MIGYHIDRKKDLYVDENIKLFYPKISMKEVEKNLEKLYSDGISEFGNRYAIKKYCDNHTLEQILELIRIYEFSDKVSRFQAFFVFEKLEDAQKFSEGKYPIYEVQWDHKNYHIGDMKLLKGDTLINSINFIREYWDGSFFNDNSIKEILVKPPVKILKKIEN